MKNNTGMVSLGLGGTMKERNMLIGEHVSLPLTFGEIRGAGMFGNAIGTNIFEAREPGTLAAMRSNGHPTAREMEVLACASQGKTNKKIANYLGVSEQTIKSHMSNVMRKLHASDRTQAVVFSIRNGWI
jgi:DNA-binding NarL/FixJ family response regulator